MGSMDCLSIDSTMDLLEEIRVRKHYAPLVKKLLPQVHFTSCELETLLILYYKLKKKNGPKKVAAISVSQFRGILHTVFDMTDDALMFRILPVLDKGPFVRSLVPIVTEETWIHTFSLFLRGTLEEKIEYCFSVYDLTEKGSLGKEIVFKLVKLTSIQLGDEESEEALKDVAEILSKKFDLDKDGKVSFEDYRLSVLKRPLLLQIFGDCLPDQPSVNRFLITFTNNCKYPRH